MGPENYGTIKDLQNRVSENNIPDEITILITDAILETDSRFENPVDQAKADLLLGNIETKVKSSESDEFLVENLIERCRTIINLVLAENLKNS